MALNLEQEVTFTLTGRSDLKEFLEEYIFAPLNLDNYPNIDNYPAQGLNAFDQILGASPSLRNTASELYDYITKKHLDSEHAGYWGALTTIYDHNSEAVEKELLTEHNICSMLESIIQETDTEEELFHWLEATLHEKKDILVIDEIAIWFKDNYGDYTAQQDPFTQKVLQLLNSIKPDLNLAALPFDEDDEIESRPPFWPC